LKCLSQYNSNSLLFYTPCSFVKTLTKCLALPFERSSSKLNDSRIPGRVGLAHFQHAGGRRISISGSGFAAEARDKTRACASQESAQLGAKIEPGGGVDEEIPGVMRHTHLLDNHLQRTRNVTVQGGPKKVRC